MEETKLCWLSAWLSHPDCHDHKGMARDFSCSEVLLPDLDDDFIIGLYNNSCVLFTFVNYAIFLKNVVVRNIQTCKAYLIGLVVIYKSFLL